jgi:hypothetical protein
MFIGYQRLNQYQHFKFKAGLECNLGFTEGRRTWNYNTNSSGQDQRIDATFALRFGVILNVYTKDKEDEAFFSD